jgi:hypothetical protein
MEEVKQTMPAIPVNRKQRRDIARQNNIFHGAGSWPMFNAQYPKKRPIMLGIKRMKKLLPRDVMKDYKANAWASFIQRLAAMKAEQEKNDQKKNKKGERIIRRKV